MPLNLFGNEGDKRRLYMALFKRTPSDLNPLPWHTALVVMPKTPNRLIKDATIFHIIDKVDGEEKRIVWTFDEPRQIYARSVSLAALMFIGKLKKDISDEYLYQILSGAPRLRYPEEDLSWRCRHWVWSALPLLVHAAVIDKVDALPTSAQVLWNMLTAFAQAYSEQRGYIACCDLQGTEIDIGFNN